MVSKKELEEQIGMLTKKLGLAEQVIDELQKIGTKLEVDLQIAKADHKLTHKFKDRDIRHYKDISNTLLLSLRVIASNGDVEPYI